MERLKHVVHTLEQILSTKRKRHLVGGILLSASIFFGGLALTVMSTKIEEEEINDDEQQID
jgi:hypothetical protein